MTPSNPKVDPRAVDPDALFFAPKPLRSMVNYVLALFTRGNLKTTIILAYAVFALTAWKYMPAAPRFADPETGARVLADASQGAEISLVDFLWNARKLWSAFLIMGVVPALIVKFVFKEKLRDYGLTLGDKRKTLGTLLSFLPIFIILGWTSGYDESYYAVYPFNPLAGVSRGALIAHLVMYALCYYTAWEFMFRGFIQRGLAPEVGAIPAVWIQIVASTTLHYGHPAPEVFGCVGGGLVWGFIAYRTRSLCSGWILHATLGILLDLSLIMNAG